MPSINANNFEIKLASLQMLQSTMQAYGLTNEDPNDYFVKFLKICDTLKFNRVTDDVSRLHLFPFTLKDKVKAWLKSQLLGSSNTWDDLANAFLAKYFPHLKQAKVIEEITSL